MTDGRKYLGTWLPNQIYDAGVLVNIGANIYLCTTSHTAGANFTTSISNWEIFIKVSVTRDLKCNGERKRETKYALNP
jgi:hypothetical protein